MQILMDISCLKDGGLIKSNKLLAIDASLMANSYHGKWAGIFIKLGKMYKIDFHCS